MSTNQEILRALDRCIEDLENMSESEKMAFAKEYWDYVDQQSEAVKEKQSPLASPLLWKTTYRVSIKDYVHGDSKRLRKWGNFFKKLKRLRPPDVTDAPWEQCIADLYNYAEVFCELEDAYRR